MVFEQQRDGWTDGRTYGRTDGRQSLGLQRLRRETKNKHTVVKVSPLSAKLPKHAKNCKKCQIRDTKVIKSHILNFHVDMTKNLSIDRIYLIRKDKERTQSTNM